MKIIIDTNRIIAALISNSTSRQLVFHYPAHFILIDFVEVEIEEHIIELLKKTKSTEEEFKNVLKRIKEKCIKIEDSIIQQHMKEAKEIMDHIDPDDTPFIAAALATNAAIWSEDKHFEQQTSIKIYKTKDLLELLQK